MSFAFLMGVLLTSTVPPWWGPDEDYHFNYASGISEKGSLPDPRKPFYSAEWNHALVDTNFNQFGTGPAGPTALTGDPHALDKRYDKKFGATERKPGGEPTRPVVHAPLFHVSAAVAMKPFAGKSVFARLWIGRFVNAFFALLIVFGAWVLAAQVFAREGPRLVVAALAATQPMINYSTGTMTNDAALVAFFTLSFAVLLRVLVDPPERKQGVLAGVFIGLALLSKSSALLLVPICIAAFSVQTYKQREARRAAFTNLGIAAGISALIAGWFYAYLYFKYGSMTGAIGPINVTTEAGTRPATAGPGLALEWFRETYSTYWMHFVYWEGPRGMAVFYVPLFVGLVGMAGFAAWAWRRIQNHDLGTALVQQAGFLLIVIGLVIAPWFCADMLRGLNSNGFAFNGGRFMMTGYPAAATLFVLGVAELVRRRNQIYAFALITGIAFWVSAEVWKVKTLDRYFGGVPSLGQELWRATFFRPEWETKGLLVALMVLIALSAATAWIAGIVAARGERS